MRTGVVSLMLLLSVAGSLAASEAALPTYKEVFRYVADQEDLPTDEGSIFKLAVESNAEYLRVNPSEWFLVVRVEFLEGSHASKPRGAQGNGPFYVFRETPKGFVPIGTMFGNAYTWGSTNGRLQFDVNSHVSAEESKKTRYVLQGDALVEEKQAPPGSTLPK